MWAFIVNLAILVLGIMIGSILTLAGIFWMWYTGRIGSGYWESVHDGRNKSLSSILKERRG